MSGNIKSINYENVNGVMLALKIVKMECSPNSKEFIITFNNCTKKSSPFMKWTLIFTILINVMTLGYVRISLMTYSIIVLVLGFLIFFWITHSVQSESVLVIPMVGIQSSIKYVYGREDNFIPWSCIDDIIINEVIKLNRVLYYLTFLVKTDSQTSRHLSNMNLLPVFKYNKFKLFYSTPSEQLQSDNIVDSTTIKNNVNKIKSTYTKPRLHMLEVIYSEIRISLVEARRSELVASGDTG